MRNKYRGYLYCGVASAALVIASSGAFGQTVVNQSATNFAGVSNPLPPGTNTISLGGGFSLGTGASVSVSATGAVTTTSITGIGSNFSNPSGSFAGVNQDPFNSGGISNNGSITGATTGNAASGSSLSVGAAGSVASFSILGVGAVDFTAVPATGDIRQGGFAPPQGGINSGSVSNTGQILTPTLGLSGTGAAVSVSAVGSQGTVSVGALGATSFTATTFGNIIQTVTNASAGFPNGATISNTVGGIWVGDLTGNGTSVSAAATGGAASVSFSYIDTTAWSASSVANISQGVGNAAGISNMATTNGGIQVGEISGVGASVNASATGSIASLSMSSVVSGGSGAPSWGTVQVPVIQNSSNTAPVSNAAFMTGGGLSGAGSAAAITATGAGAVISVSSISDTSNPALTVVNTIQTATHSGGAISNLGQMTISGALATGATASVSAVGAQGAISVSAIDADSFNTPRFSSISQTVSNGLQAQVGGNVTNTLVSNGGQGFGLTVGNVSGNGASVSVAATGAAASVSYSFVDTTAWSGTLLGGINQSVTNNGMATNQADAGISVGNIGGIGASVRASATGSIAAISLTSINSGAPSSIANVPVAAGFGFGPIVQTSINNAPVLNSASITSPGTVTGIGSSVAINATGAAASFSVASIADTTAPVQTIVATNITQTATNSGPTVQNTGAISIGGGAMGTGSAVAISAVGASASISYLAVK